MLFDLDETLYPPTAGVMEQIRDHIFSYLQTQMGFGPAEADALRRQYLDEFGTTLRGLQIRHGIDPEGYLAYVHNIPLERYLSRNAVLDAALEAIPVEKVVFTNASREHAQRVLGLLGIERHFARIVDVRDLDYQSKPDPDAYRRICGILDVDSEDCLIVEDNVRNLLPAKAIGMTTVLVRDGAGRPPYGVDLAIERIEEIGLAVAGLLDG